MPKEVTPLFIADVSAFTRALRKSLSNQQVLPGHAAMLALVAKAAAIVCDRSGRPGRA